MAERISPIMPIERLNQVEQVQPVRRRDAGSFGTMLQREIQSAARRRRASPWPFPSTPRRGRRSGALR